MCVLTFEASLIDKILEKEGEMMKEVKKEEVVNIEKEIEEIKRLKEEDRMLDEKIKEILREIGFLDGYGSVYKIFQGDNFCIEFEFDGEFVITRKEYDIYGDRWEVIEEEKYSSLEEFLIHYLTFLVKIKKELEEKIRNRNEIIRRLRERIKKLEKEK